MYILVEEDYYVLEGNYYVPEYLMDVVYSLNHEKERY